MSTEWDSAMQKFGIMPKEAEVTEDSIINMIEEKVQRSKESRLEDKTNEELEEIQDELDDEEEKIITRLREQRLAEMRLKLSKENFRDVLEVSKADWKTEINEAGEGVWVVVHIYMTGHVICNKLNDAFSQLANKFKEVKFVRGRSSVCMPNYPDSNLPTVIVYKDGVVHNQWIGSIEFGGNKISTDYLEWKLGEAGILDTPIKSCPVKKELEVSNTGILMTRRRNDSESDNEDW